jgi:hypothetical protein
MGSTPCQVGRAIRNADLPAERSDLIHAVYERIVMAGPTFVTAHLTRRRTSTGWRSRCLRLSWRARQDLSARMPFLSASRSKERASHSRQRAPDLPPTRRMSRRNGRMHEKQDPHMRSSASARHRRWRVRPSVDEVLRILDRRARRPDGAIDDRRPVHRLADEPGAHTASEATAAATSPRGSAPDPWSGSTLVCPPIDAADRVRAALTEARITARAPGRQLDVRPRRCRCVETRMALPRAIGPLVAGARRPIVGRSSPATRARRRRP